MKLLFLVLNRTEREWRMPPREWAMAKAQFAVLFGERCTRGKTPGSFPDQRCIDRGEAAETLGSVMPDRPMLHLRARTFAPRTEKGRNRFQQLTFAAAELGRRTDLYGKAR